MSRTAKQGLNLKLFRKGYIFWAKGCNGYTADLNNSEKFTEDKAKEICEGNPEKNIAWPVEYIDKNEGVQRIVDSQYLDSKMIHSFS